MPNFLPTGLTEEQIKGAGLDTSPPAPQGEEYEGPTWQTTFINHRPDPVRVFSERGKDLLLVPAKGESILFSWDPGSMFAPLKTVTYEKDGKVSVSWRHGFDDPMDKVPFALLLDNRDGSDNESIKVGEWYVEALKGIPRRVSVDVDDKLAVYKAIVWKKRVLEEPVPGNRDYLRKRVVVEKQLVPRRKSEVQKITKLLRDQALKSAEKDIERRYPGIEGGPETDDGAEVPSPDVEG